MLGAEKKSRNGGMKKEEVGETFVNKNFPKPLQKTLIEEYRAIILAIFNQSFGRSP